MHNNGGLWHRLIPLLDIHLVFSVAENTSSVRDKLPVQHTSTLFNTSNPAVFKYILCLNGFSASAFASFLPRADSSRSPVFGWSAADQTLRVGSVLTGSPQAALSRCSALIYTVRLMLWFQQEYWRRNMILQHR